MYLLTGSGTKEYKSLWRFLRDNMYYRNYQISIGTILPKIALSQFSQKRPYVVVQSMKSHHPIPSLSLTRIFLRSQDSLGARKERGALRGLNYLLAVPRSPSYDGPPSLLLHIYPRTMKFNTQYTLSIARYNDSEFSGLIIICFNVDIILSILKPDVSRMRSYKRKTCLKL